MKKLFLLLAAALVSGCASSLVSSQLPQLETRTPTPAEVTKLLDDRSVQYAQSVLQLAQIREGLNLAVLTGVSGILIARNQGIPQEDLAGAGVATLLASQLGKRISSEQTTEALLAGARINNCLADLARNSPNMQLSSAETQSTRMASLWLQSELVHARVLLQLAGQDVSLSSLSEGLIAPLLGTGSLSPELEAAVEAASSEIARLPNFGTRSGSKQTEFSTAVNQCTDPTELQTKDDS